MFVRSFAKYWVPVIAWVLLILVMSGDLMSAEHTSRFFVPFLLWIAPGISAESIVSLQLALRKAAHLAEYAILALLLCRALFRGTNLQWTRPALFASAWMTCVLVAMGDEFRQSFVDSRGASPWDVMIDSAGAMLALAVCALTGFPKSGFRNPQ
jgi:VanZ family protein